MTKPDPTVVGAEPLPGLEAPAVPDSPLRAAVRRTITAVQHSGLLTERDAATCQLALDLVAAVDAGIARGRGSAAAMAARELRETLLMLPQPEQGPDDGGWQQLVEELTGAGDGVGD